MLIFNRCVKIVDIYFYCILKACKKADAQLKIYPQNTVHNNIRYIV